MPIKGKQHFHEGPHSGGGPAPLALHPLNPAVIPTAISLERPAALPRGTPLRRWGTLVKSWAISPRFAPVAPLVAEGFRELRTLQPGAGTGGASTLPCDGHIRVSRC